MAGAAAFKYIPQTAVTTFAFSSVWFFFYGQAYPCLGHDRAAGGYAICPGLEVVLILLAAAEDEGLAAPALHVEEEPLELCGAYHCVTYFFLIISW